MAVVAIVRCYRLRQVAPRSTAEECGCESWDLNWDSDSQLGMTKQSVVELWKAEAAASYEPFEGSQALRSALCSPAHPLVSRLRLHSAACILTTMRRLSNH